jgi:cell division protein FtsW (lipid II flippase)
MHIDYFRYKRYINGAFVLALILLVLVLIPQVGVEVKGSRRWLDLGFTRF